MEQRPETGQLSGDQLVGSFPGVEVTQAQVACSLSETLLLLLFVVLIFLTIISNSSPGLEKMG